MTDTVTITQADRDAAADAVASYRGEKDRNWQARIRRGECDDGSMVLAFARHRVEFGRNEMCAIAAAINARSWRELETVFNQLSDAFAKHRTEFSPLTAISERQEEMGEAEVEKDAIARVLGAVLPTHIDWQHIREASQAFVEKLADLSIPPREQQQELDQTPGQAEFEQLILDLERHWLARQHSDIVRSCARAGFIAGGGKLPDNEDENLLGREAFAKRIESSPTGIGEREGSGASASPTVATHEPSPEGLGPAGECQLAGALAPFARVAAINAPLSAAWPDSKPNPEFLPTAWPDWGDFKRALETLEFVRPNWREETDR